MNILITGAAGFVGKNLTAALQSIKEGKDADFTVIDKEFNVYMTVCEGNVVFEK